MRPCLVLPILLLAACGRPAVELEVQPVGITGAPLTVPPEQRTVPKELRVIRISSPRREEPWRREIHQRMMKDHDFDFVDADIVDVVTAYQEKTGINIVLDPEACAIVIPPVTMQVNRISFKNALDFTMRLTGLKYTLLDGAVFIHGGRAGIPWGSDDVRAYLLGPVLEALGKGTGELADPDDLVDMVIRLLPPEEEDWRSLELVNASPWGGPALVARQDPDYHRRLELFLRDLIRRHLRPEDDPAWMPGLRKALQQQVTFIWEDTTLEDAVDFLRRTTGVNLIIDPAVLADGPPPLTLRLSNATLDQALNWIERMTRIRWVLRNQAVFLTSRDHRSPHRSWRAWDLLGTTAANRGHQVLELIHNSIHADTWAEEGNEIALHYNLLLAFNEPEVLNAVEQLVVSFDEIPAEGGTP